MTKLLILWAEALSVIPGDQHLLSDLGMFHNLPKLLPLPLHCIDLLQGSTTICYTCVYKQCTV